jgi:hypothetical protein
MQRVWYLAKALPSLEIQVERFGNEQSAVRIFHEEVQVQVLDELREQMGSELRYLSLSPAGMHRIECSIGFVVEAASAPSPGETRRW